MDCKDCGDQCGEDIYEIATPEGEVFSATNCCCAAQVETVAALEEHQTIFVKQNGRIVAQHARPRRTA